MTYLKGRGGDYRAPAMATLAEAITEAAAQVAYTTEYLAT